MMKVIYWHYPITDYMIPTSPWLVECLLLVCHQLIRHQLVGLGGQLLMKQSVWRTLITTWNWRRSDYYLELTSHWLLPGTDVALITTTWNWRRTDSYLELTSHRLLPGTDVTLKGPGHASTFLYLISCRPENIYIQSRLEVTKSAIQKLRGFKDKIN